MYRLTYHDETLIRTQLVSETLAALIEFTFGELNGNGDFTDNEKFISFMMRSAYFKPLVTEEFVANAGLLKKNISWIDILKNRFADILVKIKDRNHLYTFDEFGEGLIFELIEVHRSNIKTPVKFTYFLKEKSDKFGYENLQNKLIEELTKEYDNEVIETDEFLSSIEEGCDITSDELELETGLADALVRWRKSICGSPKDKSQDEEFKKFWIKLGVTMLSSPDYYLDEEEYNVWNILNRSELYERLLTHFKTAEDCFDFVDGLSYSFPSPIVWDWDYLCILESLEDLDSIDSFLKNYGMYTRFSMKNHNDIQFGNDNKYSVKTNSAL